MDQVVCSPIVVIIEKKCHFSSEWCNQFLHALVTPHVHSKCFRNVSYAGALCFCMSSIDCQSYYKLILKGEKNHWNPLFI